MEGIADQITWAAGNASEVLQRDESADVLQRFYQQYGPYRRYVGLAAATALLLVSTVTCVAV